MKPLAIELFSGRFGWGKGFVAEGFRVIGFDILHESYHGPVPEGCELVLQDVLTLHGSQFKDAACLVASPPCQAYSYMAMPWDRSKTEAKWQHWFRDSGSPFADRFALNDLFDACFRIQREASAAAGRYIPMVVENVKGAQPWVGRAAWHYGSYYLWGDVPALMPTCIHRKLPPEISKSIREGKSPARWTNPDEHYFGTKVSGLNWSNHGKPGYKAQAFNDTAAQRYREEQGVKQGGEWFGKYTPGQHGRSTGSGSNSRKAASAAITEIPIDLSRWIAQCFKP